MFVELSPAYLFKDRYIFFLGTFCVCVLVGVGGGCACVCVCVCACACVCVHASDKIMYRCFESHIKFKEKCLGRRDFKK